MSKKIKEVELTPQEKNNIYFKKLIATRMVDKSFLKLKEKYASAILLFGTPKDDCPSGNLYYAIGDNAKVIHSLIEDVEFIDNDDIKFCYFSSYQLDYYLPILVKNGHKVAICDQLEEPNNKVMDSKEWQRQEMIRYIIDNHWEKRERNIAARLLNDLQNDINFDYWHFFGSDTREIILNFSTYEKGLEWGYTLEDVNIDKYGWYEIKLDEVLSSVEFRAGKTLNRCSFNIVANKNKTKFTTGFSYSLGNGGGACGGSIYSTQYPTERDAIIGALDYLMNLCNEFIEDSNSCVGSLQNVKKLTREIKSYKMNYLFQNGIEKENTGIDYSLFSNKVIQTTLF